MSEFVSLVMETCAYAGSGNVLNIQKLLHLCAEHKEDEKESTHQIAAVLGVALIAFGAAVVLFALLASPFGTLLDKEFAIGTIPGAMWLGFLAIAVGTGLLAGLYPALVLSRFSPVRVLRGEG